MGTVLLLHVGVTVALAALLATVICVQGIARYSRRRDARSLHPGGRGQARARQGRNAA